ncbi:MAG: type II secretion system secretin GspD [Gammaproteobacteria bacterium]
MNEGLLNAHTSPRTAPLPRIVLMSALLAVSGCATLPEATTPAATPAPATPATPSPAVIPDTTADAEAAAAAERAAAIADINRDGRVIQLGTFTEQAPQVEPPPNNVVELNYEQEDLRVVFEQLGGVLNLNMIIDPTINTRVSLRTSPNNPLRYEDIWPVMRQLARNAGVTIEQAGNVWEFTLNPSNVPTAIVLPDQLGAVASSEVLQVTPLTYISVEAAETALTPMLQPPGSLIRLGTGNLIGIYGSPEQLERINALLAVLDDDPFANHGIQLYPLQNSSAAAVAEELQNVLTMVEGEQSSYQVLGLERINAVLVVAPAARGFEEVARWIRILDSGSQDQGEQLFVYRVKNLTATTLSETLVNVFGEEDDEEDAQAQNANAAAEPVITQFTPQTPGNVPVPGVGGFTVTTETAATPENIVSGNLSVTIVADEDTNSLLVRASPREYRQLLTTIAQLDSVPLQVMINGVIGQVRLTDSMQFGIDWTRVSANSRLGTRFLPGTGFTTSDLQTPGTGFDPTDVQRPGSGLILTRSFMDGAAQIDAMLRAIGQDNEVRLLARPTLIAMNNKEGEIKVGQRVPVNNGVTVGVGGVQTSNIAYQDVGIVLTITPRINDDGHITLEIFQSLSSVEALTAGVNNNPTFTNQEITTTVVVADQETIALGGLIQEDATNNNTGVPYLQKIPVLGGLFSYQERSVGRRELFIIIHPQIIQGGGSDSAQMQAFRESFTHVSALLREAGL